MSIVEKVLQTDIKELKIVNNHIPVDAFCEYISSISAYLYPVTALLERESGDYPSEIALNFLNALSNGITSLEEELEKSTETEDDDDGERLRVV
jgi:hypothetical protein